jgi:hypothetical protein
MFRKDRKFPYPENNFINPKKERKKERKKETSSNTYYM